jgi:PIN domain nuclease of toxin-antitoxin system
MHWKAGTMSREAARALLLDTHIWLWYVENDARRFARRIETLVEAAVQRGELLISAISVWEIAVLDSIRRIERSQDVRTWVGRALSFPGVRFKGLSPSIAIESVSLPGQVHRDPADRILIATARLTGAALVTSDARILSYARQGHVRVLNATR